MRPQGFNALGDCSSEDCLYDCAQIYGGAEGDDGFVYGESQVCGGAGESDGFVYGESQAYGGGFKGGGRIRYVEQFFDGEVDEFGGPLCRGVEPYWESGEVKDDLEVANFGLYSSPIGARNGYERGGRWSVDNSFAPIQESIGYSSALPVAAGGDGEICLEYSTPRYCNSRRVDNDCYDYGREVGGFVPVGSMVIVSSEASGGDAESGDTVEELGCDRGFSSVAALRRAHSQSPGVCLCYLPVGAGASGVQWRPDFVTDGWESPRLSRVNSFASARGAYCAPAYDALSYLSEESSGADRDDDSYFIREPDGRASGSSDIDRSAANLAADSYDGNSPHQAGAYAVYGDMQGGAERTRQCLSPLLVYAMHC